MSFERNRKGKEYKKYICGRLEEELALVRVCGMMEERSRKRFVFVVAGSNEGGSEWYVVGGIVVGVIVVILLLILLVVLIACKPWRYFRSSTRYHLVLDPSKVQIASVSECSIPFGVGLASDPMALRRGGKKLPMEDVCYYLWPLPGHDRFGFFGICDGHGGAEAAKFASKCMPETLATVLSESFNKEKLLSHKDASHVLRETFYRTEELMNHYYEGCTATLLLIWRDGNDNLFAQCSNVGDAACIMNVDGKLVRMTEDHRVTSSSEILRIRETGEPLKDGETRLCGNEGLNLARMLGDKFLKQQDTRFSSEPYVSQVVQIDRAGHNFAIIASDGFWDVIGVKKSVQLVYQMMKRYSDAQNLAEKIADTLLNEARNLRTKDNTSIIFLNFGNSLRTPSSKEEA